MRDVVIIGAGIAGLTAAYELSKLPGAPFRVTVLEAEDAPGGQARAFRVGGKTVEHGSHAFFGYYRTVTGLIDELRADPLLAPSMPALVTVPGWTLVAADGRRALLTQSKWLPTLAAALPSIFRVPWLSLWDKVRAAWGALRLLLTPFSQFEALDRYTSYEYGRVVGYTQDGILTWNMASLGLTNLFVQEQSAAILGGKHKLLVGTPRGLSYQLPAGDLSELFAEPMRRKIEALGGEVLTGARATAVESFLGRKIVRFARGGDSAERQADYVVVALQPKDAARVLGSSAPWWATLGPVSPVITVVLGLSGRVGASTDAREYGCSREDWSFSVVTDLSRYWPEYAGDKTVLRVEIGHADLLPGGVKTDEGVLLALIKHDLARLFPEVAAMQIEWSRVHREERHLYVKWARGEWSKKPSVKEREVAPGVFLAGDWTSNGTIGMEAAANSGIEAANMVLAAEGLGLIEYEDVPL